MDFIFDNIKKCGDKTQKNLIDYSNILNQDITINLEKNNSIFLNNIKNSKIFINSKINHIICRNCANCEIYIEEILISGIDILYSEKIKITSPFFYFFGLEYNECIEIYGIVNKIAIIGCQEIDLNRERLPINVFTKFGYNE